MSSFTTRRPVGSVEELKTEMMTPSASAAPATCPPDYVPWRELSCDNTGVDMGSSLIFRIFYISC